MGRHATDFTWQKILAQWIYNLGYHGKSVEDKLTQAEAQKRVEQIQQFKQEMHVLNEQGIASLSQAQQNSISQYHADVLKQLANAFSVDINPNQKQLSLGMKIASLIGALAFSASIFFLFFQFWGQIPTLAQVAVLATAPIATLVLAIWLKQKEPEGFFAKIAAMISLVCFVLNLVMFGQMFNINPSPNAFLIWSLFSVILAYACNARLLLFFAICLFSSFIAMKVGTYSGMYWIHFGERPENFFIPAIVIFCIPIFKDQRLFQGFETIYRVTPMILLFISILILANWGQGSYLQWDNDFIEGFYQVIGFVLATAGICLGIKRHWPDVVTTANVFFILFLYTKIYDWFWEWMPKYIFFLLTALIAILALIVFKRFRLEAKKEFCHEK